MIPKKNKKKPYLRIPGPEEVLKHSYYGTPKWKEFIEQVNLLGLRAELKRARNTRSKYITVTNGNKKFKVRFSDHIPTKDKVDAKDSDFYVGKGRNYTANTHDAINAIRSYFGIPFVDGVPTGTWKCRQDTRMWLVLSVPGLSKGDKVIVFRSDGDHEAKRVDWCWSDAGDAGNEIPYLQLYVVKDENVNDDRG